MRPSLYRRGSGLVGLPSSMASKRTHSCVRGAWHNLTRKASSPPESKYSYPGFLAECVHVFWFGFFFRGVGGEWRPVSAGVYIFCHLLLGSGSCGTEYYNRLGAACHPFQTRVVNTSGFRGGAGGARPILEIPKRVFKEGQRGRTPPAPPLLKFQRGSSNGTAAAPPPLPQILDPPLVNTKWYNLKCKIVTNAVTIPFNKQNTNKSIALTPAYGRTMLSLPPYGSSNGSGGARGSGPPLLGHDVAFLTLGPKLDPPFLLVDLRWTPPPFQKSWIRPWVLKAAGLHNTSE